MEEDSDSRSCRPREKGRFVSKGKNEKNKISRKVKTRPPSSASSRDPTPTGNDGDFAVPSTSAAKYLRQPQPSASTTKEKRKNKKQPGTPKARSISPKPISPPRSPTPTSARPTTTTPSCALAASPSPKHAGSASPALQRQVSPSNQSGPRLYQWRIDGLPANNLTPSFLIKMLRTNEFGMNFSRDTESLKIRGKTVFITTADEDLGNRLNKLPSRIGNPLSIISITRNQQRSFGRQPGKKVSYSCVIKGVHKSISDEEVLDALNDRGLEVIKVWRITSRQTNKPTTLVRVLSNSEKVIAELMMKGLKVLGEVLHAEASHPPPDQPLQCVRCLRFHSSTAPCERKPSCGLCSGEHTTNRCQQDGKTPIKCANCGGNHAAFSYSCPRRPKAPLAPEVTAPIKCADSPSNPIQVQDVIRCVTIALLNIFPEARARVLGEFPPVVLRSLGLEMKFIHSNQQLSVAFNKISPLPLSSFPPLVNG